MKGKWHAYHIHTYIQLHDSISIDFIHFVDYFIYSDKLWIDEREKNPSQPTKVVKRLHNCRNFTLASDISFSYAVHTVWNSLKHSKCAHKLNHPVAYTPIDTTKRKMFIDVIQ